eukprot:scaffold85405_cov36-Phaeocystis_antarctica.AAC.1
MQEAEQHGHSAAWAEPQLGSRTSSGHAWRLWAARYSQQEAGPLDARASRLSSPANAADSTAFDHVGGARGGVGGGGEGRGRS